MSKEFDERRYGENLYPYGDTNDFEKRSLHQYNEEVSRPEIIPETGRFKASNLEEISADIKITSVEDLTGYARGKVVRLPDFAEDQPFIARVRRPSMLVLAKQGKIPNELLAAAGELFTNGPTKDMTKDSAGLLRDMYDICEIIAESTLIEPSYKDILDSGLTLADDQLMAIFNYSQLGVKALESFRED